VLFGGNASDPVSLSSHGFTSKNDKKVTEYVNSLERYWLDHRIPNRIQCLSLAAPDLTRKTLRLQYDAIDRDITWGMLAAEKTVRHPDRKYQWSKQLDEAGYGVWYWKMRLSAQKCNSSGSPCLDKICDHANIDPAEAALSLSIDELTKKLTTARQDLKEIQ
jgi:hypothetical protein